VKRILILGVAALVLAVLAPSIGTQGVSGLAVAQAQTPTDPADPADPAYRWPALIDEALEEASERGIEVLVEVTRAPRWANGGRPTNWAPRRPAAFAAFAEAASRRYPGVSHWLIWGEPSRHENFRPLRRVVFGRRVPPRARRGPRLYARILDGAYGRLKAVDRSDLVIGGNTFTTGDAPPRSFVKLLRLPNGRPPRMDLYGHNPFTARQPALKLPALNHGWVDFGTLDTLVRAIDRNLGRRPGGGRLRLFLGEWTLPTDHANREFNFWVTRKLQARWLAQALRVTRRWKRIYSLAWLELYDEPPNSNGDEVNRGLLDHRGNKKPSYAAFKKG